VTAEKASRRGQTLRPGHALVQEGMPHDAEGRAVVGQGTAGRGRAKCECGWLSPVLPSGRARRNAHALHKAVLEP
jgi:hypothetical protein